MVQAVGTLGLDAASPPNPTQAFQNGSRYQMRYSAGVGNSNPKSQFKLCGTNEIAEIKASGQQFLANSEWYETRCTEGAPAGAADGAADLAFWKSRSLPQGETIYISWDAAPNSGLFGAVKAYIEAYNAALQGYYVADGLYAGVAALIWMSVNSITRHGWIPEAASWSTSDDPIDPHIAPPANSKYDYWFPTPSQVNPAISFLNGILAGHHLVSCIWQCGNKLLGADVNYVNIAGELSSVVGGSTPASGGSTPVPPSAPSPAPAVKIWQGYPTPGLIQQHGQYLGSISGPAASHGGYNPSEKAVVKVLQQRLIACGFVPGVSDPNSGWADGIFDTPQDAPGTGATSQAVQRFHDAWYPNQPQPRQIWSDDWRVLFDHA